MSASRVGYINDEFVLNPSTKDLEKSKLDLIVAGTESSVMMVESEAKLLTEQQMLEAVKFGHEGFKPVIGLIKELVEEVGKPIWGMSEVFPQELKDHIKEVAENDIIKAFDIKVKQDRYTALDIIAKAMQEKFTDEEPYDEMQVAAALADLKSEVLRNKTLTEKKRIDGRNLDQVRDIACEVGLFKNTHGSALFTRGETQALVSTTLGTAQDGQVIDDLEGEYKERFLLNYLFPPYSVGEALPLRPPSRREIGHGKLAWRALKGVFPGKEFPYTIRVVSEITESNGSSSMATVCGASMSMMNAGVPITAPVAGIAMGLVKEKDEFVILSDIVADEDHLGDMDFKVAGTTEGVTALQMDIKVAGITLEIMEKALEQAKAGRIHILEQMTKAIDSVHDVSNNAPVIVSFQINKDKIKDVIGPGGKVIRDICETTGAKIDINDDGTISVAAVGKDKLDAAVKRVKEIAIDPKVGDIFNGTVVKLLDAGAFVNFIGTKDGFVHISEISHDRIKSVDSVLSVGQKVKVKLIGYDRGKAKLTIKNAYNKKQKKDVDVTNDVAEEEEKPKNQEESKAEVVNNQNKSAENNSREGAKKWNNNSKSNKNNASEENDVKERKYFD